MATDYRWVGVAAIGCMGWFTSACRDVKPDPQRPDTGYGAGQKVPPQINCDDFCTRLADCNAQLCLEDTGDQAYAALRQLSVTSCTDSCVESVLVYDLTQADWQCYFGLTCRQVFDYDTCQVNGRYQCQDE